jgi:hypothetical protein
MTGFSYRLITVVFMAAGLNVVFAIRVHAQPTAQQSIITRPQTQAEIAAEREKIWDSPDMLRARAWLKDYCSKSAKVTPEMAEAYQKELANMTPTQLKLWLLKFDEQEEQRQQQYAMFQQANAVHLQQAAAARKQTQQAYANINQAESQAAQNAQGQINEQRQAMQQAQQDKQLEMSTPYPSQMLPYGGYGYGGYPYGGAGIQYHYHLY